MRLKLDENLGRRVVTVFVEAGHDVATVHEQDLTSATDVALMAACLTEQRVLVTLDLDFANPLRFDPSVAAGIAVLRVHELPRHSDLLAAAGTLAVKLEEADIVGRLWVVDGQRVRQYEPEKEA